MYKESETDLLDKYLINPLTSAKDSLTQALSEMTKGQTGTGEGPNVYDYAKQEILKSLAANAAPAIATSLGAGALAGASTYFDKRVGEDKKSRLLRTVRNALLATGGVGTAWGAYSMMHGLGKAHNVDPSTLFYDTSEGDGAQPGGAQGISIGMRENPEAARRARREGFAAAGLATLGGAATLSTPGILTKNLYNYYASENALKKDRKAFLDNNTPLPFDNRALNKYKRHFTSDSVETFKHLLDASNTSDPTQRKRLRRVAFDKLKQQPVFNNVDRAMMDSMSAPGQLNNHLVGKKLNHRIARFVGGSFLGAVLGQLVADAIPYAETK